MTFLSSNLMLIVCLVAGFILLIWEAFMPGFGVPGILGIVLEIIAIFCAFNQHGVVFASLLTFGILFVIGVTLFLSYRSATRGKLSKSSLILNETETPENSSSKASLHNLVNTKAIAVTPLRPEGMIEVNGERISAATTGDFLQKGSQVIIARISGNRVIVKPVQ